MGGLSGISPKKLSTACLKHENVVIIVISEGKTFHIFDARTAKELSCIVCTWSMNSPEV